MSSINRALGGVNISGQGGWLVGITYASQQTNNLLSLDVTIDGTLTTLSISTQNFVAGLSHVISGADWSSAESLYIPLKIRFEDSLVVDLAVVDYILD